MILKKCFTQCCLLFWNSPAVKWKCFTCFDGGNCLDGWCWCCVREAEVFTVNVVRTQSKNCFYRVGGRPDMSLFEQILQYRGRRTREAVSGPKSKEEVKKLQIMFDSVRKKSEFSMPFFFSFFSFSSSSVLVNTDKEIFKLHYHTPENPSLTLLYLFDFIHFFKPFFNQNLQIVHIMFNYFDWTSDVFVKSTPFKSKRYIV